MALPKSITIEGKPYSVSLVKETDEGENEREVLLLKNGKNEYRLSPMTTAEELKQYANPNDEGHTL